MTMPELALELRRFARVGHWPTLAAAFLYFDFCFAIWVLNGAMAPFISEELGLGAAETGVMVSVPIMAGALMRLPLGVLAQYIGRKRAALLEMGLVTAAMLLGWALIRSYQGVVVMGVMLGIAGASFGIALALGSGWYPQRHKGLAMGIAGAGNSGTVLAMLLAPPLATLHGWRSVYGFAALAMLLPLIVMAVWAKEPPDRARQSLRAHVRCLFERDGWIFNFLYVVTFGGFIGLANFLPTYFHEQFDASKVAAGQLTILAAVMGSGVRVLGGWLADRWGGVTLLSAVLGVVVVALGLVAMGPGLMGATLLFMLAFAALGAGNGALFQLVPQRWPRETAVAGSMIGEVGALGGAFVPLAMGFSQEWLGSFSLGFVAFAVLAAAALGLLRSAQSAWAKTWNLAAPVTAERSLAVAPGEGVVHA
jgi:NNP family nitrate/nitrite transporter-like MFS transporter